jgi:hypothetical protein
MKCSILKQALIALCIFTLCSCKEPSLQQQNQAQSDNTENNSDKKNVNTESVDDFAFPRALVEASYDAKSAQAQVQSLFEMNDKNKIFQLVAYLIKKNINSKDLEPYASFVKELAGQPDVINFTAEIASQGKFDDYDIFINDVAGEAYWQQRQGWGDQPDYRLLDSSIALKSDTLIRGQFLCLLGTYFSSYGHSTVMEKIMSANVELHPETISYLFNTWIQRDPEKVSEYINSLPAGKIKGYASIPAANYALMWGDVDTARAWAKLISDKAERESAEQRISDHQSGKVDYAVLLRKSLEKDK